MFPVPTNHKIPLLLVVVAYGFSWFLNFPYWVYFTSPSAMKNSTLRTWVIIWPACY
jgi:hypothetical protein